MSLLFNCQYNYSPLGAGGSTILHHKTYRTGTGLGLSLSYDIIRAHGGEIKVETKEREGSEFIVVLE